MTPTKPPRTRHETPLAQWLRKASKDQRQALADAAETDVVYLYSLASGRREPKLGLAVRIASGTRDLHAMWPDLPALSAEDLIVQGVGQ